MTLTRKEAIDRCGIVAVNDSEQLHNLSEDTFGDGRVVYTSYIKCWDYHNGRSCTLQACYYQSEHTIRTTEDFDALVWTVDHYEIV